MSKQPDRPKPSSSVNVLPRLSPAANAAMVTRTLIDPDFTAARRAVQTGNLAQAEPALKALLQREPANPLFQFQMGELEYARNNHFGARGFYEQALRITPGFLPALYGLSRCQGAAGEFAAALATLDLMLAIDPGNIPARHFKAATCNRIGDHDQAIDLCRGIQLERPGHVQSLFDLGHALRYSGRKDEAVAVYREIIRVAPRLGDPWLFLADLKTYRITDEDLGAMTALHQSGPLAMPGQTLLEYALGRAWYDRGDYAKAHAHYLAGNTRDPTQADRRIETFARWTKSSIAAFADAAQAEIARVQGGRPSRPQPVFILGMPRVGSTLVEQILASHSQIEATDELPYMEAIAHELIHGTQDLARINKRELARRYLSRSALHRHTERPWFIDKLPFNYRNVALIKALLPGSRIIDVRRHPLASTVAMFRQSFTANLAEFSGSLAQLAETRRDYANDMALFEAALPGSVLRVHYEDLVENVEAEVRRMLAFIGVPFEPACLRWYERKTSVRTPSSEQVRQPIYRSALEEWRNFEPWLGEAKLVLRDELARYPAAAPGTVGA